jgi:hypothetical protein
MTDATLKAQAAHLAVVAYWAPGLLPCALAYWSLVAGRG